MENTIRVRFASLKGKFEIVLTVDFPTMTEATRCVTDYATKNGLTGVKLVRDEDSARFTGRTPNGRSGRNIAFVD